MRKEDVGSAWRDWKRWQEIGLLLGDHVRLLSATNEGERLCAERAVANGNAGHSTADRKLAERLAREEVGN